MGVGEKPTRGDFLQHCDQRCGYCSREWWKWVATWTKRPTKIRKTDKARPLLFYEAAATSVKPVRVEDVGVYRQPRSEAPSLGSMGLLGAIIDDHAFLHLPYLR